jgi:hypothetical protein
MSLQEAKSSEVSLNPSSLNFNHRLEGLRGKGIARPVERDGHPAAIGVPVESVTSRLAVEGESITL